MNEAEERGEVGAFEPFVAFVFFALFIICVRGKDTGDVFPDDPTGAQAASQCEIFEGEVAARIIQSETLSSDGKGLTRGSSDQKVNRSCVWADRREVAIVRDSVLCQRLARHV
ncbi:MAG: hypothetical protein BGP09_31310 [Rhizobium sp. 60-20]|nr:MAG: hypothetical protein BGP09_31310 [Rhizobium sp. 60-20]